MTMNFRKSIYSTILLLFLTVLAYSSCTDNDSQSNQLTQNLKVIDDSIAAKSPGSYKLITDAMHNASDSLEYYEYAARMSKYFVLSATPDSALPWVDKVMQFAGRQSSPESFALLAYVLNTKAGFYHNYHKNTEETITLYSKAYHLLMQSNHKDEAPDVCANLGDAYVYESKLPEAASWYRRALFLSDSLQLPEKDNLSLYMGLALIYQQLGDNDKALSLYQQTDRNYRDMQLSMQLYFINNYGGFYYYTKDYPQSLKQFKRLEKLLIDNKMENNFDMYLCRINLADVYLNLGDTKKAEEYLNLVEPFWKKNGDKVALYYCNTIRLGIAIKDGDIATADRIVKETGDDSDIIFNMREIRGKYLRKYYGMKGDWHSAYTSLLSEETASDSLEHNRTNMRAADIMAQYSQDTLQLHKAITIEHKTAEVERMRLWLVVAIAAFFVLVLLFVAWMLMAHRNKLKSQMEIMNLKLVSARNRISPHFIFNVLNNQIVGGEKEDDDGMLKLTKLIRTNLDMAGQITVPLSSEIDFVNKYVAVEKDLLPDDNFTYSVNVDKEIDTDKTLIPSMAIQILVENAFVHGLMGRNGAKSLCVRVERLTDGIRITVADNGPGFDIRSILNSKRTGLSIIRQTVAAINQHNKRKIKFELHNGKDAEGNTTGCNATLTIPDNIIYT